MQGTLEKHKAFPLVAWGVFILFAGFTLYLAFELQETAAYLDGKMDEKVDLIESV